MLTHHVSEIVGAQVDREFGSSISRQKPSSRDQLPWRQQAMQRVKIPISQDEDVAYAAVNLMIYG